MSSAAAAQRVPSPFLAACRGEATARTPVWLMRQAGRYLPEYRDLRARHSMAALLGTPELAVEATLLPLRCFPLDAAIVFSDLLQPLVGMGLDVSYDDGGPVVANPLRAPRDIDMLAVPPAACRSSASPARPSRSPATRSRGGRADPLHGRRR